MVRTCIRPEGKFVVGVHKPSYNILNFRNNDSIAELGKSGDGKPVTNSQNFPEGNLQEDGAKWIYEIPNVFSFRGTTFIDSGWAKNRAENPDSIKLGRKSECSLSTTLAKHVPREQITEILTSLPQPVLYGLAATSTDAEELVCLALFCSRMIFDESGKPLGLRYIKDPAGRVLADIDDFELFETIANNYYLPDVYKEVMVLRPGVQGNSEIVGEFREGDSHVFEYLRRNSYIPWGHYATNMANDAIRYKTSDLSSKDMEGLRFLYYQRVYVTLAQKLGIGVPGERNQISDDELEKLRLTVLANQSQLKEQEGTLWGWNFGYDISASGYRLHASHQMIHQQYAMVPQQVETLHGIGEDEFMAAYSSGDLVADAVEAYQQEYGRDFFSDYLLSLRNNVRIDNAEQKGDLIVWEDANVILFVPKAQMSQWELQLMVTADTSDGAIGNIVEADSEVRKSLDRGILVAQRILAELGAKMVTSIEFSKRIGNTNGQRLLYSFLPKLPWSMGAFSEAQLRFICGHFPEDFAICCRQQLKTIPVEVLRGS